jgi:hypothetical protein
MAQLLYRLVVALRSQQADREVLAMAKVRGPQFQGSLGQRQGRTECSRTQRDLTQRALHAVLVDVLTAEARQQRQQLARLRSAAHPLQTPQELGGRRRRGCRVTR